MNIKQLSKELGRKIKFFRNSRELTQAQLALFAEVHIHHISQIENGNKTPSLALLAKISEILNYPLYEFVK